jgi:hypothetical protein
MMSIRRLALAGITAVVISGGLGLAATPALAAFSVSSEQSSSTTTAALLSGRITAGAAGGKIGCQAQYVDEAHYDGAASDPYGAGNTASCVFTGQYGIAVVNGLTPSATYHFRIVATEGDEIAAGEDRTFQTAPLLSAVVESESATPFAYFGATLKAQINPELSSTTYQFQYGPTFAYSSGTVPVNPGVLPGDSFEYFSESVEYDLTGLSGNTTYHYRVVATNPAGTTYGEDQTVTTPPPPPSVVTGVASGVTQTDASVTGTVNPEGLETSYYYQYGLSTEYGQVTPALPGTAVGSGSSPVPAPAFIQPLTPGETYHYRLVASNEDGTSYGQDETLTTVADEQPLASTGAASGVSVEAATISGTIDPRGNSAGYSFEYGTTTAYGTQTFGTAPLDQGVQTVTLALRGLQAGTIYHYRLVASNPGGTSVGEDGTFATPRIASPIIPPSATPLIAIPSTAFPKERTAKTTPKTLTKAQKLAAALKACAKKPKKKRAFCRKQARKR